MNVRLKREPTYHFCNVGEICYGNFFCISLEVDVILENDRTSKPTKRATATVNRISGAQTESESVVTI